MTNVKRSFTIIIEQSIGSSSFGPESTLALRLLLPSSLATYKFLRRSDSHFLSVILSRFGPTNREILLEDHNEERSYFPKLFLIVKYLALLCRSGLCIPEVALNKITANLASSHQAHNFTPDIPSVPHCIFHLLFLNLEQPNLLNFAK